MQELVQTRVIDNGSIYIISLNRHSQRNAIDKKTSQLLVEAFNAFEKSSDAKVAILYGGPSTFCGGADLKALGTDNQNILSFEGDAPLGPSRMTLSKPCIAAITGYAAAGGLELACWCDMRIAEEDAVLGVLCRRFGIPLIDGGTVRLSRLIGLSRASDLILTGREVTAKEAYDMGLINRIVPKGQALEKSILLARQLCSHPQQCMRSDRMSMLKACYSSSSLEASLQQEFQYGMKTIHQTGFDYAKEHFVKNRKGLHGAVVSTDNDTFPKSNL